MELQKIIHTKAFTLVELIIIIVIISILSTIGYTSFKGYLKDTRDSTRLTSMKNVEKGLDLYKIGNGKYPIPDEIYGSGNISGVELVKVGKIGDSITRLLKISGNIKDPLSNSNYTYGITSDGLIYQIGGIYEGDLGYKIINKAYAEDLYKAKVIGNYGNLLSYKIGTDTYYGNIPSIIFSNTGSSNLLGSGTYYIVDKKGNIPYTKDGNLDTSVQKIDGNQMIKEITQDNTTSLTGIKTTGMTLETIENYFTGEILKNFSINGQDTTLTLQRLKILIGGNNKGSTIDVNNQGCSGTSSGGYTIPNLINTQNVLLSKPITNGTGSINVSCSNGTLIYGTQNNSCITNYVYQGGSCVLDVCQGSAPSNSQSTATSQNAGASWTHTTTPGVCTFVCQVGYYYSGGNCVQASAGYMVGLPGQTSQTACGTGYYQDLTGQSSCKVCSNGPANSGYTASSGLTSNTCPWSCSNLYYQSGGSCLGYVNGSCSGIPANGVYYNTLTSYTLSGATNGTSLSASYSATPLINTCQYKCNSGYYNSGSSCLAYVNGSCTGIPSNAQYYNGTASYSLVNANNGTSLTASYNVAPTSNTCQYKCNSGYTWNGSSCVASCTSGYQLFTSNGTFTLPSGCSTFRVLVIGGGGGGSENNTNNLSGGNGGAVVSSTFTSSQIGSSSVAITVGAGGVGGTSGNISSFGSLSQASGGGGIRWPCMGSPRVVATGGGSGGGSPANCDGGTSYPGVGGTFNIGTFYSNTITAGSGGIGSTCGGNGGSAGSSGGGPKCGATTSDYPGGGGGVLINGSGPSAGKGGATSQASGYGAGGGGGSGDGASGIVYIER